MFNFNFNFNFLFLVIMHQIKVWFSKCLFQLNEYMWSLFILKKKKSKYTVIKNNNDFFSLKLKVKWTKHFKIGVRKYKFYLGVYNKLDNRQFKSTQPEL